VLVSTFTEIPVGGLIASVIVKDPGTRHALHLVFGLLCGWALVCVLGDRWLVRAGCHVLTETELDLQVGARAACCVPIAAVERCELLRETPAEWLARHGLRLRDTLTVTPLDRPNIVLVLKPDALVSILHCQVERNPSCIFLYLDRPEALSAALAAERGAASCRGACADRVVTGLVRV
jgi:hypothetical protein